MLAMLVVNEVCVRGLRCVCVCVCVCVSRKDVERVALRGVLRVAVLSAAREQCGGTCLRALV